MLKKREKQEKCKKISNKSLFKKQQGITLVALVITIIVLLILAGITIGTLSGDNGILNNTGKKIGIEEIGTHTLRKTFRLSFL